MCLKEKKMKKIILLASILLSICSSMNVVAQQRLTPEVMKRLFPASVVSPEYNKDGTVTFRFTAPNAQKVELNCQMFNGNQPMQKDDKGVWSITVKPEVADIFPYCFIVDGTQVTDPNNYYIFPNEGFKNSLVDVKGETPSVQDIKDVPHGRIQYRYYHSDVYGFDRPMCVYTPAGYDPNGTTKYPVLYLIHGMTDTYETWFKVGKVNVILDNLIADGAAKKMIIVMPYANAYPEMQNRKMEFQQDVLSTDKVTKEILEEVIPFVESNYKVAADADNRAIAGFSLGGRQTLAAGLGNPYKFHWVCALAPAIFGPEIEKNFTDLYAPSTELNNNVKLLWLSCGKDDFLYNSAEQLDKVLTEKGVKHETVVTDGGHTWMNCRKNLANFSQRLFK